jgi:hypothetical protein
MRLWTRNSQCVVCCVEEMCGALGSGSCLEEVQCGGDDEAEPKPVPSFTEVLRGFEPMRVFMYAQKSLKETS